MLARENTHADVSDGLTYAEEKHLGVLNLPFIDREIAAMEQRATTQTRARWIALAVAVSLLPLVVVLAYQHSGMDSVWPALALAALAASAAIPHKGPGWQPAAPDLPRLARAGAPGRPRGP